MLKTIADSPKAEIREKSKVTYDFSEIFGETQKTNDEINRNIRKYEELQAKGKKRAASIHFR